MPADFEVGDVVELKSGGPKMTVTSLDDDPDFGLRVWCTWFDGKGQPQERSFQPETLEKI